MKKLCLLFLLIGCDSPRPQTASVPARVGQTIAAVLSSAGRAANDNPHHNPALSRPPRITLVGNTPAAESTVLHKATAAGALNREMPVSYYGGDTKIIFDHFVRFPVARIGATGGNVDDGYNATAYRVAFATDAPVVNIGVLGGSAYRFIVDGSYVSLTSTVVATGGVQFVELDFRAVGGSKQRIIQLEGQNASGFYGVAVPPSYPVQQLPPSPKIIFVGDSFTLGAVIPNAADGYARVAGDFLGVPDTRLSGIGGTGYTKTFNNEHNFAQRLTDWTTKDPDVVVFAGGLNDDDNAAFQPAVLALLQATRTALPETIILVLGVFPAATGPNAAVLSKEHKIAAAVTQFADPYTRFIPVATDPAGAWVTGTGRVGAPTGVGNSDQITGVDGTHPSVYGHLFYGQRATKEILSALRSLQ